MIGEGPARRFAHQSHADLHVAQQDIVLLYALELLRARGVLPRLAFKGGSYLRKMLLGPNGRFSEDLDFTALKLPRNPERLFRRVFAEPHEGIRFAVEDPYTTGRGWACAVGYEHAWDRGRFKLEVSFREKPTLPVEERPPLEPLYAADLPFPLPRVTCLQMPEALAEKIRAAQQRATDRDVFDVIQYSKLGFKPELVRLLSTVKLWNDRQPFDAEKVLGELAAGRRDWPELRALVGRRDETDWNRESRKAAERFDFLRDATDFERRLIADHRRHALASEIPGVVRRTRA